MIHEQQNKFKSWWGAHWEVLAICSIIILVTMAAIGLWRLTKLTPEKAPVKIEAQ